MAVASLLAACGTSPSRRTVDAASDQVATAHYQAGRYQRAALAFRDLARAGGDAQWLVRAADAAWQFGNGSQCRSILAEIDSANLYRHRELFRLLQIVCAESLPPAHVVLAHLDFPASRLPPAYRATRHRALAQAFLDSGQTFASARERLRLQDYLLDQQLRAENQEQLLRALQQLPLPQVQKLLARYPETDPMHPWLALVAEVKTNIFGGRSAAAAVAAWRSRFPDHAAAAMDLDAFLANYDLSFIRPQRVALLLPLSGPLQRYAEAVRDGFMAAYYADEQRQTEIRMYDAGQGPDHALAQYRQALSDGADQVVGPLDRDAVTALLLEADGSAPVLALNYQEGQAPPASGLYQFGLMPEDEAVEVAERMLQAGAHRTVVLTPSTGLGERIRYAFTQRYEQLGGQVLADLTYAEEAPDYGAVIRQAVGVTASRLRQRQLQRLLNVPLHFEPQRRHDLDAVFLAARPRQGRRLKPQLAFYNAGEIPVFATSHVYSGWPQGEDNRDLDGVTFCDAPWVLDSQSFTPAMAAIQSLFPETRGPTARFFALGMDAYRVLPYLSWLDRYQGDTFPGATGQLSMDGQGRIHRQLDCATFQGGVARYGSPMDWSEDAP